MLRKTKKGFTLVELVVVIAVIAILAAVSVVTYVSITNKAKQSADEQTVEQYNTVLSTNRDTKTMHDAMETLKDEGILFENVTPKTSGAEFAYNLKENKVVLIKDNKIVYPKALARDLASKEAGLWKVAKANDGTDGKFSWYLSDDCDGSFAVTTGLDVGDNDDVTTITYTSTGPAQEVVIRSNSYETVVNATAFESGSGESYTCDVIKHYGKAGEINIVKAGAHSYHEFGDVAFLYIESGHAFVEYGSKVVTIVSGDAAVILENSGGTVENAYGDGHSTNTGNIPLDQKTEEEIEEAKEEAKEEVMPPEVPEGIAVTQENYSTVFAENGNETYYLSEDVEASKAIKLEGSLTEVVLNLNGHILSRSSDYLYYSFFEVNASSASFKLTDTAGSGYIDNSLAVYTDGNEPWAIVGHGGGTITIESGSIVGKYGLGLLNGTINLSVGSNCVAGYIAVEGMLGAKANISRPGKYKLYSEMEQVGFGNISYQLADGLTEVSKTRKSDSTSGIDPYYEIIVE